MSEKEKDPAYLMYSKDWLEGTAEMTAEEKGVFIDLLCHQHQKISLPNDIKRLAILARKSESEFLIVWETLKHKFIVIDGNRLVNRKLTKVMGERSKKSNQNKIIGTLASVVRLSPAAKDKKDLAKKGFNPDDFSTVPDHQLTERITEWFDKRLLTIEDANGIENEVGSKEQWNKVFEISTNLELPKTVRTLVELNQYTFTQKKNTLFVQKQWEVFLNERVNDPPVKKFQNNSIEELGRYFINWMRNKFPNGAHKSNVTKVEPIGLANGGGVGTFAEHRADT